MVRICVICPDSDIRGQLIQELTAIEGVFVARTYEYYPYEAELLEFLKADAVDLFIVSIEKMERALEVIQFLDLQPSRVPVVSANRTYEEQSLVTLMRAGVRHILTAPFTGAQIRDIVETVRNAVVGRSSQKQPAGLLHAFLPAKAGVGTSVLAANVSHMLARASQDTVLLLDLDLNQGTVGLLFNVTYARTVHDAAERALFLDEHTWPEFVAVKDRLHILKAGPLNPGARIEMSQLRRLLDYTRTIYGHICVDLSGNMEKYSIEVIQSAARIFLVCSPEPQCQALARQKLRFLEHHELARRTTIVLNHSRADAVVQPKELEKALGAAIGFVCPYDPDGVGTAIASGRAVKAAGRFGRSCTQIAAAIAGQPVAGSNSGHNFIRRLLPSVLACG